MRFYFSHLFFLGFFFVTFLGTLAPSDVVAAGLVPCGRTGADATVAERQPCTLCHLVIGGNRVIQYGIKIMIIVALVVIVAMAILYIISTGSSEMMNMAKGGIKAVCIGVVVMLGAWLIVNTTLRILSASVPGLGMTSSGFTFSCDATSSTRLPSTP